MFMISPEVLLAFGVCVLAALSTILGTLAILNSKDSNPRLLAFGLSFAGGAMIYISLVEIFGKSLAAFAETLPDKHAYAMATLAFFVGVMLIVLLDKFVPNPHTALTTAEMNHGHGDIKRAGLMAAIAITAHNLPEGMATFFSTLHDPVLGIPLAAAIAIHNIPEGVSIAIPIYFATGSKRAALIATAISAIAEPLGAVLGYTVLAPFLSPIVYGWVFGVIAGVMVFLALDELLPTAKRYSKGHETTYGMILGMGALALSLVLFR